MKLGGNSFEAARSWCTLGSNGGRTGLTIRLSFFVLHGEHAATMLLQQVTPPAERGTT